MNFYMQNKHARKKMPPVGTKKYPVYFLGAGKIIRKSIVIDDEYPIIGINIEPKFWRFYSITKRNGKYLEGITSVQFKKAWIMPIMTVKQC